MKNTMMIIRLTYLASSVFSLAAASKAGKSVSEPTPPSTSKAGKSSPAPTYSMSYSMSTPSPSGSKSGKGNGSKSSKSKSDEYFIAPFSCPQKCISAEPYELSNHLLVDGAVTDCDASDSYQKWKVHRVGSFLKFESAAQHYHNMCLAVVHQDPNHDSNTAIWVNAERDPSSSTYTVGYGSNGVDYFLVKNSWGTSWLVPSYLTDAGDGNSVGVDQYLLAGGQTLFSENDVDNAIVPFLSENDVDGICSGILGLAKCDHPGTNWYNTGGNLLSALCWNHDTSTAMSVNEECTGMEVVDTTISGDLTTSETFMLLGSD